uniref:Uncharacterized protein n=1 Tax=Arundo donax TaxID=35708 RepID=A0A0A9F126_ARUDO
MGILICNHLSRTGLYFPSCPLLLLLLLLLPGRAGPGICSGTRSAGRAPAPSWPPRRSSHPRARGGRGTRGGAGASRPRSPG